MRPILPAAILLLAFLSLPAANTLAQETERVVNGNFSAGLAPWWKRGASVRVQSVAGRNAALIPAGMVVQEGIKVTGGRNYRISVDLRADAAPEDSIYVQMSFRGQAVGTEWRGPATVGIDGRSEGACQTPKPQRREKALLIAGGTNAGWQPRSVVVSAPPGADQMILYLRKAACTAGAVAFTAVSVQPTDAPETSAQDVARDLLAAARLPHAADPAINADILSRQTALLATQGREHRLAAGGTLRIRVHVGRDENVMTLQAAADLSDFLAKIAGASAAVQLSTDEAIAEGQLLVVGRRNALARQAFEEEDFASLGDDGFLIRSFGPHILIAGRTERGTMYGVNWLLDRKLGVRWLAPGFTHWPKTSDITLPALAERQVPRFLFREILSIEAQDKEWRQRNLMNGESHGPSFEVSPPALDSWNRSWASRGIIENFFQLLPPATYQARHPDWYAGGQLAMMNEEMRAEMARVVIGRLRALPDYRNIWFAVHDMDWGWDMDPASAAFARRHGGHESAPRLDMMIDIADRVRAELPGARLAFNAYHWSFTPPEGMTVPDHILVYPMTIHVNYRDPLDGPANRELGRDLDGWNRIARHVLVWDHITNFAGFLQPTPNILPIARSIRWLSTLDNVEGYMGEGSFNTPGAEFSALRAWLISRLLWNPGEDPDALIKEFSNAYYGPAGPMIKDYILFMHRKLASTEDVLAEKTTVDMAMFDAEFVRQTETIFDQAEKAAAGTPYLRHVQAARMPVDYVVLLRRAEYSSMRETIGFDVMDGHQERLARFWRAANDSGVRQYIQGDRMESLRKLFSVERHAASTPDIVTPGDAWSDIQDISLQRFAGPKSAIVADPVASDGAAIALDRSSAGWNTQLKLDKLPRQGEWWLYAAIRKGTGESGSAIAKLGSAPPMDCSLAILGSDLVEGAYRWFEVPGGPFRYTADHGESIYLQPERGEGLVLIDRLIALPTRNSNPTVMRTAQPCR